jgi:predicted dehydrogenase
MEKLKAAVIGCGRMGASTSENMRIYSPTCWFPLSHIEAIQASEFLKLEAICDTNTDLLEKIKKQYRVNNIFTDYRLLLDNFIPDILTIATRTPIRPEIIKYGISRSVKGFHIEKPLCNSIAQLEELQGLSEKNGINYTYGTLRRYFSIYHRAKALVTSGELGALKQITINFGSSPLFWTHPHSVDMILFFAENRSVDGVQAKLDNLIQGNTDYHIESDPSVISASIYFNDGVTGIITQNAGSDVILSCTKGEIIIEANGRSIITRRHKGEDPYFTYPAHRKFIRDNKPEGTMKALSYLYQSIHDNHKHIDLSEHPIFLGQRILFAFVQSHIDQSRIIKLDEINKDLYVLAKSGALVA